MKTKYIFLVLIFIFAISPVSGYSGSEAGYSVKLVTPHEFSDTTNPVEPQISLTDGTYKIQIDIYTKGVGGMYNEGGYKLYLVPEQTCISCPENYYKMNFIVNPKISGYSKTEGDYRIGLNIYSNGVGGDYKEKGYRLYLVPEEAFISHDCRITANDPECTDTAPINHNPEVSAGSDMTVNEGDTFSGSGSFTDPDEDTWTATVDYGDGSGSQALTLNSDKTFSLSHTYADSGIYTVTVVVTDDNGGVGTDTATVTVTDVAPDTEPPTIISAILNTPTTIPDATVHVTVETTDNIGVKSVTADGTPLVETGSVWEGDISAPSAPGDYTMTIRAEDAAGNFAESSVPCTVVTPQGGVGVDLIPTEAAVTGGDSIEITVKVTNTENFDDTFEVALTYDNIPPEYSDYMLDFTWTDWPAPEYKQHVLVKSKSSAEVPLTVTVPPGESGYKLYSVTASSMNWITEGSNTGGISVI